MIGLLAYAIPAIFLVTSPFLPFASAHDLARTRCIYLLFKWITDYRKCTMSYLECKIRGVPKEEGYINRYLNPILNINKRPDRYLFYLLILAIGLGQTNLVNRN
jgi:hypothetical protein